MSASDVNNLAASEFDGGTVFHMAFPFVSACLLQGHRGIRAARQHDGTMDLHGHFVSRNHLNNDWKFLALATICTRLAVRESLPSPLTVRDDH